MEGEERLQMAKERYLRQDTPHPPRYPARKLFTFSNLRLGYSCKFVILKGLEVNSCK